LKLGVCISTKPAKFEAVPFKGDFVRNVAAAREIGFDGVELAIRDPRAIDQDLVLRTILDAGMEIPAIGTGQAWGEEGLSFTDPDPEIRVAAIERVHSHFGFARRARAMVIIGLLRGKIRPGVDESDARRWMLEAFRDCCEEAAKQGVRIAFEPINRYETSLLNNVADGLAFIDQVGADNLGMLLDTFHMNIEEPSIEGSIRLAGDRIFHVHCADSNRWYPGAGHLDFPSMVATLSSVGYGGYLSGEHRSDPDPVTASRNGLLHRI
jgi:sugar phosphate isomerase/epimerase